MGKLVQQQLPASDPVPAPLPSRLTLESLLSFPRERLSDIDIAEMNLTCAAGLPGAEDMDIPKYLHRLEKISAHIGHSVQRDLPEYRRDPRIGGVPAPESYFFIARLATVMKENYGLRYNPDLQDMKRGEKELIAYPSSKDLLINGLLSDQRTGTCNSIPVVIVAVGRRLGYPLHISANRFHVFARWDGDGQRFNIDASGPGGFSDDPDDHFRTWPHPWPVIDKKANYYLKNFKAADELALFLFSRCWVLQSHLRFEETLPLWAKACHLAPNEPSYASRGVLCAAEAIYLRKKGRPMSWGGKSEKRRRPRDFVEADPRDILPPKLAAAALSLTAHYFDVRGEIANAKKHYKLAIQTDPDHPDYPAALEDYLKRSREQLVQGHMRSTEAVRRAVPDAKAPPLEGSVKLFCESLDGKQKSESPAGGATELLDNVADAQARQYQSEGERAMDAGRWAESQSLFARAWACAPEKRRHTFRAFLFTALRKEVMGIAPLKPEPPKPHDHDDDQGDDNPLEDLAPELQGYVWFARAHVLEGADRLAEAINAFSEAIKLAPKNAEFLRHHQRASAREAQQRAQSAPRFPLSNIQPAKLDSVYVMTPEAAFGVRDGGWLPPVVIPPRDFSRPVKQ